MGDKPLVSVVTIFLNEEKFINEAIESVLNQTYDNWELLLVDDGSTDNSTNIAKEFAQAHPTRIFYLEHKSHQNKGMSASRNLGVANSHGAFVAFLDADDVWLPNKLEKQVNIIKQNPDVGLVINPVYYWHEDGRKEKDRTKLTDGVYPPRLWFDKLMEDIYNTAYTCGVLIRRDTFVDVGGSEESFRGYFEDTVLWIKISLNTSIYFDSEYLSLYRNHSASNSNRTLFKEQLMHSICLNEWLEQYLRRNETKHLTLDLVSMRLFLILGIMRQCYHTEQREIIAALSYVLEPLMPELLKNPEWNYFTGVAFQYLPIDLQEAVRRYDIALKYGFDEFGVPIQDGYAEFDAIANRGMVYAELGKFSEAIADLQRAVKLKPDHQYVREKLEKLLSVSQEKLSINESDLISAGRIENDIIRAAASMDLPYHSVDENRREWNTYDWAEKGEEWTADAENPVLFKQNLLKTMHRYIKPNSVILEIGPGAGRWTRHLQHLASKLIAVDIAPKAIEECRKNLAGKTDNIEFHLIQSIELSFVPNNSVDFVWSYDVFVHMNPSDALKYIREFARVMKKSAIAIIHHPDKYDDPKAKIDGWRSRLNADLMKQFIQIYGFILVDQNRDLVHKKGDIITIIQKP